MGNELHLIMAFHIMNMHYSNMSSHHNSVSLRILVLQSNDCVKDMSKDSKAHAL